MTDGVADLLDTLHHTAVHVLETVILLDQATFNQATFNQAPSAAQLRNELGEHLRVLAQTIDALPPEVIRARRNLRLAELARLPALLARPDIQPSVRVLRRTLETPMREIIRVVPKRARVPKGY
jgi:hypothetical protein